jgi:hypothetical protein
LWNRSNTPNDSTMTTSNKPAALVPLGASILNNLR